MKGRPDWVLSWVPGDGKARTEILKEVGLERGWWREMKRLVWGCVGFEAHVGGSRV